MTEKLDAARLAEELEEFAEMVHGETAYRRIAAAATLIREQQERIRTLEGENERLTTLVDDTRRDVFSVREGANRSLFHIEKRILTEQAAARAALTEEK